jgi:hypothetical protein
VELLDGGKNIQDPHLGGIEAVSGEGIASVI